MRQLNSALLRQMVLCLTAEMAGPVAADVPELPQEVRDALDHPALLDPMQPIGDSAHREFIAKNPPPRTIGYASSCAGNTWRAAVMASLQNTIIPKWPDLAPIDEVIITQPNLNDSVQLQQMRQLVDQVVDAIIVCCSNLTALNATVEHACQQGVPAFSGIGYRTSPYPINSSANFVVGGRMLGEWMANEIGGEGIPGAAAPDSQNVGIQAAPTIAPGVNVMDQAAMIQAIPADCSERSDQWYHPGIGAWAGKEYPDQFFQRPADPESHDPASHPVAQQRRLTGTCLRQRA